MQPRILEVSVRDPEEFRRFWDIDDPDGFIDGVAAQIASACVRLGEKPDFVIVCSDAWLSLVSGSQWFYHDKINEALESKKIRMTVHGMCGGDERAINEGVRKYFPEAKDIGICWKPCLYRVTK